MTNFQFRHATHPVTCIIYQFYAAMGIILHINLQKPIRVHKGYREDLTDEEAYDLGRRSIYHATFRDAASGGIVRVYHMTKDGFKVISEEDCMDLHYKYAAEKIA